MKTQQAWRKVFLSFAIILVALSFSFFFGNKVGAQLDPQNQNDAIGIRVIPNPNHFSVSRWYESQGFSGSPQALTVDGYEALRDGRTVYINAAHILPETKQIYTNIYLISYNQDQSNLTMDILGQIIAHWKFNDNLSEEDSTCSMSAIKCTDDVDCPSDQSCSLSNGTCKLAEEENCKVDDDCPSNYFCNNVKSKIIRDLNRVGKIEELRESLARYREKNGRYPLLSAGTYLPGVSTTLWPSWQETFLPSLGGQKNFLDPINRFGYCSGFDIKTCWDKDAQQFVYPKNNLSLKLPDDSYALVYSTNDSGSEYNLCAVMESRDDTDPNLGYSLTPNDPEGSNCVTATGIVAGGNVFNTAPQITDLALGGVSGLEYNGFVRANDRENDPLYWTISPSSFSGWVGGPIIKGTNDPTQKKIFADKAGSANTYPITITVTDSKGASTATTTSIVIKQANTMAEANEYIYRLDPVIPFNYSYFVTGSTSLPQYSFNLISGTNVLSMANIQKTSSSDGINRVKVSYSGIFSTSLSFKEDTESVYTLVTSSDTDATSSNKFVVKVKVDRPILDFSCESQVRVGYDYSCRLGSTKQSNHTISYSSETALPAGLEIVEVGEEDGPKEVFLQGVVNTEITGQEIRIKAVNEYDTENTKSFVFRVNNYCGDGAKQAPNLEGKGGMYNNGYEACDGGSSVASSVTSSDKNHQYACNTKVGEQTPYPIAGYSYCVFKSPFDGGGFCGDTYCQMNLWSTDRDCNNDSDCGQYEVCNTEQKKCYQGERKCTASEVQSGVSGCCRFDCDPSYLGPPPTLPGGEDNAECSSSVSCTDGFICMDGSCRSIVCGQVEETTDILIFNEGDATLAGVTYYYRYNVWNQKEPYKFDYPRIAEVDEPKWCCADNYTQPGYTCPDRNFCTYVRIDNPVCSDDTNYGNGNTTPSSSKISCPVGYSDLTKIGKTDRHGSDTCRDKDNISNYCGTDWCGRYIYSCSKVETFLRCFGALCRPTLGSTVLDGTMNASGECVKNPPVCGDGSCNGTETCSTCDSDCGVCSCWGDYDCDTGQECCGATGDSGQCCNLGACYDGNCYSH